MIDRVFSYFTGRDLVRDLPAVVTEYLCGELVHDLTHGLGSNLLPAQISFVSLSKGGVGDKCENVSQPCRRCDCAKISRRCCRTGEWWLPEFAEELAPALAPHLSEDEFEAAVRRLNEAWSFTPRRFVCLVAMMVTALSICLIVLGSSLGLTNFSRSLNAVLIAVSAFLGDRRIRKERVLRLDSVVAELREEWSSGSRGEFWVMTEQIRSQGRSSTNFTQIQTTEQEHRHQLQHVQQNQQQHTQQQQLQSASDNPSSTSFPSRSATSSRVLNGYEQVKNQDQDEPDQRQDQNQNRNQNAEQQQEQMRLIEMIESVNTAGDSNSTIASGSDDVASSSHSFALRMSISSQRQQRQQNDDNSGTGSSSATSSELGAVSASEAVEVLIPPRHLPVFVFLDSSPAAGRRVRLIFNLPRVIFAVGPGVPFLMDMLADAGHEAINQANIQLHEGGPIDLSLITPLWRTPRPN